MITFPVAKINIGLHVVGVRPDGYHNIESVFYPVNLQDALEINHQRPLEKGLHLNQHQWTLHVQGIPVDGDPAENLVVKAYNLLLEDFRLPRIDIRLFKTIPSGAGLGGGSSDAASMIALLNRRFRLRLRPEAMERYAARLGADCPFFIKGRPVIASGIGEILTPIELSLKGYNLLLVKPAVHISTAEAYSLVEPHIPQIPLAESVKRPIEEWKSVIVNDFEKSVFNLYPQIAEIKEKMYDLGALYASMTGSGSAVYGIFPGVVPDAESQFGKDMFCRQVAML